MQQPNMIQDVKNFLTKYEVPMSPVPDIKFCDALREGIKHLKEELAEIETAIVTEDYLDVADGLADLIYVAINVSHRIGFPIDDIWRAVHKANMNGKRKVKDASESKRGNPFDVIKTSAYVPPDSDISDALGAAFIAGGGLDAR